MLYFAPLGFLSYSSALLVWTIVNLMAALACIYLIYDQFFKTEKLNGLILVSTLFFLYRSRQPFCIRRQISYCSYLLLIKNILTKELRGLPGAGNVYKALCGHSGFIFPVKKNWKAVLYFVLSTAILCGLTFVFLGRRFF
jgi:hypothetical protein